MVFYVVKKMSQPKSPREERHGPYESLAVAHAKARMLASTAKVHAEAYEVVCDFA